jgi:organic hydroperoxide reductase OsmC/OhrA
MSIGQVVLYFDKQEDAVDFALAASAVISDSTEGQAAATPALTKIAEEICKVSRITTEGVRLSGS